MVKYPPRTLKQRLFVREYIRTGCATKAALMAYDVTSRHSAEQIGYENLRKLELTEQLDEIGLTDERLARVIADEICAMKLVGKPKISLLVPDWAARHRALEIALQLKNLIK